MQLPLFVARSILSCWCQISKLVLLLQLLRSPECPPFGTCAYTFNLLILDFAKSSSTSSLSDLVDSSVRCCCCCFFLVDTMTLAAGMMFLILSEFYSVTSVGQCSKAIGNDVRDVECNVLRFGCARFFRSRFQLHGANVKSLQWPVASRVIVVVVICAWRRPARDICVCLRMLPYFNLLGRTWGQAHATHVCRKQFWPNLQSVKTTRMMSYMQAEIQGLCKYLSIVAGTGNWCLLYKAWSQFLRFCRTLLGKQGCFHQSLLLQSFLIFVAVVCPRTWFLSSPENALKHRHASFKVEQKKRRLCVNLHMYFWFPPPSPSPSPLSSYFCFLCGQLKVSARYVASLQGLSQSLQFWQALLE